VHHRDERLDDRLFFANASYVKGRVQEALRSAPDRHDGSRQSSFVACRRR
jgi:hypothetical protein